MLAGPNVTAPASRVDSDASCRPTPTPATMARPKNVAMETPQSHERIAQFCVQLIKRRPDVPGRIAISRAVSAFPHAADLHPDEAARLLAAALPLRMREPSTHAG